MRKRVNPQLILWFVISCTIPSNTVTHFLIVHACVVSFEILIRNLILVYEIREDHGILSAQYFSTYFSNLIPVLAVWDGCDLSGGTRTGCWCTWPSIIFLLRAVWNSLPRIYSHSSLRMIRFAPPTTTTTTATMVTTTIVFQDANNVNYVIISGRESHYLSFVD